MVHSRTWSPDPESDAIWTCDSPVPERSPNLVRPLFRDESDAHPNLSQMPIRKTGRV